MGLNSSIRREPEKIPSSQIDPHRSQVGQPRERKEIPDMRRTSDTTFEAEQVQLEIFRRMGPEKRLQCVIALSQACRELLKEGVRRRHPEYNERQITLAVARLMLPEKLFLAAYPEGRDIRS